MTSPRYRSDAERRAQWRSDSHRLSDILRDDAARLPADGRISVTDVRGILLRIAERDDRTHAPRIRMRHVVLWGICGALFGWSLRGAIG